ncbi:MAG TPA: S1/P1 nuclease [Polyangiaceae bacterium]|nr:S1/P1 nuclease [Polyangiaceae bacterium]
MTQASARRLERWIMPLLFGAASWLVAPKAHAWGDEGHRVVGELAYRWLSPRARARVNETLTEAGYQSLAEAATWPDTYARRHPEYDAMKPFHYVNVQPTAAHYDRDRDCPNGCVVTALAQFVSLLGESSPSLSERRRCIYWVAHFMGDIHQPLHIAHPDGKGGIATLLWFFDAKDKRNAHWIWDNGLIERRPPPSPEVKDRVASDQPAYRALADELAVEMTPARLRAFQYTTAPEAIADEGLNMARRSAYLKSTDHVDDAYEEAHWPLVKQQLQKAGARLAAVLERALGAPE